jgi:ELWxxDGT repeat protein
MRHFYLFVLLLISSITYSQITLVKDINASPFPFGDANYDSSPDKLFAFNGKFYFAADDSQATNTGGIDAGKELWVSDGTPEGTVLLKDLDGSADSSNPNNFFELNNKLYFNAANTGADTYSVYTTDGTEAGTTVINDDFRSGSIAVIIGNKAYLRNFNADYTGKYYEFDGTTFTELPDVGTGTAMASSEYAGLDDNSIIFNMKYDDGGTGTSAGIELYIYDITNQTYTLIKDFNDAGDTYLSHMTKLGNKVYFEYDNGLWVTDGTSAGTTAITSATSVEKLKSLYAWEGKLYFEGDAGSFDQLWVYDPVAETTTNISGYSEDNPNGLNFNHDPVHFAAPGDGYLYYAGKSASTFATYRLYRTDGVKIEPIEIDLFDDVDEIIASNNKLYFEASYNTTNDDLDLGPIDIGKELFTYTNDKLNTLTTTTFELDNSFSVYPNPSANLFNVKTTLTGSVNYTLYNILGAKVLSGTVKNDIINHNLQSGMYLLKLDNGSVSTTKKVIVKN